ncbi:hypothetical protein NX029_26200 [Cytobacillus firmus]|nr:hypothetical protein [Cytobacillus firmus]
MVEAIMELLELEHKRQLVGIVAGGFIGAGIMYGFFFIFGALALMF